MENLSYSLSGADDDISNNEFDDINNREMRSNSKNNRYFDYEYESDDEPNQKIQNPRKRLRNPRKTINNLKNEDTNKSQKRIPRKKSIKRKNSISKTTNDLHNENDINSNLIVPKKSRKKSISKSANHQISREEDSEKDFNLPKMKAVKRIRQNSERTAISTRTVVKKRKNKKNFQDLSENFDFPHQKSKKNFTSLVPKQEFSDKEEDIYKYKSETEISNDNQFEIEITLKKDEEKNQADQGMLPNNSNKAIQMRSINDLNGKNNNVNQKQSFRPKIEEFFYDIYSEPPKLRIDTTLVAQSNNHPELKLSEPYQVSTYSKILDSDNSSVNQNNDYLLRDLIVASESESNSSKEKMLKTEKFNHLNNHNDSNSDYTEVNTKPKDISTFDNETYRKNANKINPIKLGKDKELIININFNDKFNSARSNNSVDIDKNPKQTINPQKVDFQGMNETNFTFLNDSQKINPQIKPKSVESDKKLAISPSIDVYKNQYDLNVVNNCQNASDTVIVRVENEKPAFRSALQIQQTNSHQQYLSNNKDNPKSNTRHQNEKNVHNRNISINDHKNDNKNNKNEKQADKNRKRGNSVPRHKPSHEEQKRSTNDNNNGQEQNNSAYEIQLHNDGDSYVGSIEFRNGKLVRRVRVKKSQRSSSVVPNNSYNRIANKNQNQDQNYQPYNHHHSHHHNNNVRHYSTQSENGQNDHHHHQKRSASSLNRIRVKKNEINGQQNGQQTKNNSVHHSHRSNSVPRKNFSPLYCDKREKNDDAKINVSYVFSSSELNDNEKKGKRSSSTEKVDAFIKEEKETQTPKEKRSKIDIDDAFSSSTNEILQTKSVFIDLSNIDKKEEEMPKENQKVVLSEIDDDLQPMISSDFGANSSNQKKKNWYLSQSNELSQNSSFNSQSESKKKRRKRRQMSRSSSRSSISISMATPSPSASEIPTSEYEIIQTPIKEFIRNKNAFISEISSQFQEEEQESEDSSYLRLRQQSNQSKMKNNQTDKKRKNSKISNHSRTNSVKNSKSNINSLFDVASSSDEDDNNINKVVDEPEINSFSKKIKQIKSNSEMNSSSSHRHRKRILKEANESSQIFTPTINSDYSSSFHNSNLASKKNSEK